MAKQRWGRILIPVFLALAGAGAVWLLGGFSRREKELLPPGNTTAEGDTSAVSITVEPVTFRPVQRTIEAVGTLYGYEEVSLCTKVEGRVRKIHHEVSDRVQPGEVLLEIDPTDYEISARQAEKALEVELAKLGLKEPPDAAFDVTRIPSVVQARVKMENIKERLDRARAARTGISPEELADKAAEHRVAQAEHDNQVLVAKAGLATIQVKQEALAMSRQQHKDALVRAPIPTRPVPGAEDGVAYVITQRVVAEGSYVRSGMEVFKLAIDQTLKLRALVPERHASDVVLGQKAEVFTAAYQHPYLGTVTRINPAVDPVTRTFEVEIQVPNPKSQLKPGAFAKTIIVTRGDAQAATVPLEALVNFAGITKLFVVENGRAKEVQVILGIQSTKWVEIAKPSLSAGESVVTSGQTAVADGTPVTIRSKQ